jgi:hypothetical protein
MDTVQVVKELQQLAWTMGPDDERVIHVAEPAERLVDRPIQSRFFKVLPTRLHGATTQKTAIFSLNLVGFHAVHVNVRALTLFNTVKRLFGYFSCSSHRWIVLKDFVNITVKRYSDTRWSSKAATVNSISR